MEKQFIKSCIEYGFKNGGRISKGGALELFNRLVISSGASYLFCFTDEKYTPELRQQNTAQYWRKVITEAQLNHAQAN